VQKAQGAQTERDTIYRYEDGNLRVVSCSDQNKKGDLSLVSLRSYDQLGRVRLNQQLETPSCGSPGDDTAGIKVASRYVNSGGNSYKLVSNPFRAATSSAASNEPTMGWTLSMSEPGWPHGLGTKL
jgi:hypothetical protein